MTVEYVKSVLILIIQKLCRAQVDVKSALVKNDLHQVLAVVGEKKLSIINIGVDTFLCLLEMSGWCI